MSTRPESRTGSSHQHIPAPRSAARLMVDPVFGTIMWGKLVASSGAWMHVVVAAIVIYDVTGSTLLVGMVSAVQFGPQLFLSLMSGSWADRGHAFTQIVLGRLLTAVASGGLGLWFLWQGPTGGHYGVIATLAASLLMGSGFAIAGPPLHSIVPSLIRPGELPVAMALNTAPLTFSVVLGPVIGAYAAAHLGAGAAFGAAGIINLLFVVMFLVVRVPRQQAPSGSGDHSVRLALRHIWHDRPLFALLLGIAGIGFSAEPSLTLAPALVAERGGASSMVGALTGSFGAGAAISLLLFSLLGRWVSPAALMTAGLVLMATGLTVAGLVPSMATTLAGLACTGFGFTLALSSMSALVQERAPEHLRGRVMAVWTMAAMGSRPIAATIEGSIADLASVQAAMLCPLPVLACVLVFTRRGLRTHEVRN